MRLPPTCCNRFLFAVSILAGSCTRDFEPREQPFPLIQTMAVSDIDNTGAQFNARVIKAGTDAVVDFGFMYVERPNTRFKTVPDTFSVSMGNNLCSNFSTRVNHNLVTVLSYNVMAYAVTAHDTVIGNSVMFKSESLSPTEITSFSPNYVLDGDTLTIFGENFNRLEADYVFIGGQFLNDKDILRYSNKLVTVTVPPIARPGPTDVIVDAYFAKTKSDQLIVISPSISFFSPTHGPAGQVVTLNGRFSSNINYNKVLFNGVAAPISVSTKHQITVQVPSGLTGSASIAIYVNGKTFTSPDAFIVE